MSGLVDFDQAAIPVHNIFSTRYDLSLPVRHKTLAASSPHEEVRRVLFHYVEEPTLSC